jgi:hypothetical protein
MIEVHMSRIRLLTFIALVLAAWPSWAFGQELPLTEQQFLAAPTPAASVADGADVTPYLTILRDTLIAALLAIVTAAAGWLSAQISRWTHGRIALDGVARDLQMEDYARLAVDKALSYALQRTGTSVDELRNVQVKSQVLQYAMRFLTSQYPEVVRWIDADDNGVIDWVETHLPATAPAAAPAARVKRAVRQTILPATPPATSSPPG